MAHQLTPYDLQNNPRFELLKQVSYANLKDFVFTEIQHKSKTLKIYGLVQIVAIVILCGLLAYFISKSIASRHLTNGLKQMLFAGISSFTFIIPIHEGIHALAFILRGKKDISFGAQWRKFMFYAESNLQVLNRKEIYFVALAPFILVAVLCLFGMIIFQNYLPFFATLFLAHIFFCSGDWTIVSFFNRHLPGEIYTYDSRTEKQTFYYLDLETTKNQN